MYADDLANVSDTVTGLQSYINIISTFCDRTGMKINVKKTKVIVFRNGGTLRKTERWYYNDILLETVSMYKYMGFYITPTCLASQAKKAIISMIKLQNSVGYFEMNE